MKISLCIICRDEEKKIARCINSVKEIVDEVIIVDTGSKDQTVSIVEELGCKVFQIEWEEDFSKARNYAISKCKGEWIIFLDADEYLSESSISNIKKLIQNTNIKKKDYIICEMFNIVEKGIESSFKTIRIFRNSTAIRYEGRIHEKLFKKTGKLEGEDCSKQIKIYHDGYMQATIEDKKKKERNQKMLLKELQEYPESSDVYFYLMQAYINTEDIDKAWECGIKAIEYKNPTIKDVYEITYQGLLQLCNVLHKDLISTEKIYQEAIQVCSTYPDIEYHYAFYLYEHNQIERCINHLEVCLEKIKAYSGTALSAVCSQVIEVWELLSECYIQMSQYHKAVPLLVKILQLDLYRYKALYNLIEIIQGQETGEAIGQFLCKLYNLADSKDQVTLLTVSKKVNNAELFNFLFVRANEQIKKQFKNV